MKADNVARQYLEETGFLVLAAKAWGKIQRSHAIYMANQENHSLGIAD